MSIPPASLPARASAVIVGGGVLGAACAYHLTLRGLRDVVVIERARSPMLLTSARSTECFRDFFDTPPLVGLVSRSIEGIEHAAESAPDRLGLDARGYLYVGRSSTSASSYVSAAQRALDCGAAGPLRRFNSAAAPPSDSSSSSRLIPAGFDVYETPDAVRRAFPFLFSSSSSPPPPGSTPTAALHARRAGWVDAHRLGHYFLDEARSRGARVLTSYDAVSSVVSGDRITGVDIAAVPRDWDEQSGALPPPPPSSSRTALQRHRIETPVVINAAGPYLADTHRRLLPGVRPPAVRNELHPKVSFRLGDPLASAPAAAAELLATPMVISSDETLLSWDESERAALEEEVSALASADAEQDAQGDNALLSALLGPLPGGLHGRPLGRSAYLALWEWVHHGYPSGGDAPDLDVAKLANPLYTELLMRALPQLLPAFGALFPVGGPRPSVHVDGGYYCTAMDGGVPLVGPVRDAPLGAFVCGAFRGIGVMSSYVRALFNAGGVTAQDG